MIGSTSTTRRAGAAARRSAAQVALGRGRLQPLDAVAPVPHAELGQLAGQRRVAQARRAGSSAAPGSSRAAWRSRGRRARGSARSRARSRARCSSRPARASCAHMITTSTRPTIPSRRGVREPTGGEQQERRQRDGEVAVGPGGGGLRERPGDVGVSDGDDQQRDGGRAPMLASVARRAAARAGPAPAQISSTICGIRPSSTPGTPSSESKRGASAHGAPVWAAW